MLNARRRRREKEKNRPPTDWSKFCMPVFKNAMPSLIMEDLISVQPMSAPSGTVLNMTFTNPTQDRIIELVEEGFTGTAREFREKGGFRFDIQRVLEGLVRDGLIGCGQCRIQRRGYDILEVVFNRVQRRDIKTTQDA